MEKRNTQDHHIEQWFGSSLRFFTLLALIGFTTLRRLISLPAKS